MQANRRKARQNNLCRNWLMAVCALLSTLCSPVLLHAQTITPSTFGMHIRCTPGSTGQNADCQTPTPWPQIPESPDPNRPFGSLRMHDDGTKFGDIEAVQSPACNLSTTVGCNWAAFDAWIREARRHRIELLYTLSKTPEWACAKHHGCAPSDVPEDRASVSFLRQVRDRQVDGRPAGCRSADASDSGCIRYWEVWNEPNNGRSAWCGSISDMVHVARLMREVVTLFDSSAKVLAPGVGHTSAYNGTSCNAGGITGAEICAKWGKGNGNPEAYICEFLRQRGSAADDRRGRDYVDFIAWHSYPTHSRLLNMAEDSIVPRADNIKAVMRDNGMTPCSSSAAIGCNQIWITETSWGAVQNSTKSENEIAAVTCGSAQGCPRIAPANDSARDCERLDDRATFGCWADDQAAFLVKQHLIALSSGVSRVFWYWWEGQPWGTLWCKSPNGTIGCTSEAATKPYLQKAGHAYGAMQQWLLGRSVTDCSSTAGIWSCTISDASRPIAMVQWSVSGENTRNSNLKRAFDIYGTRAATPATIGYMPILFETWQEKAPAHPNAGAHTKPGVTVQSH